MHNIPILSVSFNLVVNMTGDSITPVALHPHRSTGRTAPNLVIRGHRLLNYSSDLLPLEGSTHWYAVSFPRLVFHDLFPSRISDARERVLGDRCLWHGVSGFKDVRI